MKRYLLLLTMAISCMTANAAAPKRPMLEQGKTWEYVYHQRWIDESQGSDVFVHDEPMGMVYYQLKGDTIIDGRQYMKMYRFDEYNNKEIYYGAFREDEEGRVYSVAVISPSTFSPSRTLTIPLTM